jgi:hypothetical protein
VAGASLNGVSQFASKARRFAGNLQKQTDKALYQETQIELKEVKRRTPVEFGELRASEHVEGPTRQGNRVWTNIVAGGPSAPYAIYVHEDLDAFHPVGQAKYIESVLLESRPFMAARVAKRIDLNKAWNG